MINTEYGLFPVMFSEKTDLLRTLKKLLELLEMNSFSQLSENLLLSYKAEKSCLVFLVRNKEELKEEIHRVQMKLYTEPLEALQQVTSSKVYYEPCSKTRGGKIVFMNPPGGMVNNQLVKAYYGDNTEGNQVTWLKEFKQEAKENALMKQYFEEIGITSTVMKQLNDTGISPDIVAGASMGEIALLLSLDTLTCTNAQEKDTCIRVIQNVVGLIKEVLNGQQELAKEFWKGTEPHWEKWYIKEDISNINAYIGEENNIMPIILGSPRDVILCGKAEIIEAMIRNLGCFAKKLEDANYIHTKVLEKAYDAIYQASKKEALRLEAENTPFEVYSTYFKKPFNETSEMFSDNLASILTKPVDFAGLLKVLYEKEARLFIDLGTSGICAEWTRETLIEQKGTVVETAYGKQPVDQHFLSMAARLMAKGFCVDGSQIAKNYRWIKARTDEADTRAKNQGRKEELLLRQMKRNGEIFKQYLALQSACTRGVLERGGKIRSEPVLEKPYLYNRDQIEHMTDVSMADILGEKYLETDSHKIRSRMPSAPYLFVSRIIRIDGEFGKLKESSIEIEYEVGKDCILRTGEETVSQVIISEASHCGIFLAGYLGVDKELKGTERFRVASAQTRYSNPYSFVIGDVMRLKFTISQFIWMNGTLFLKCYYQVYKDEKMVFRTDCICGYFTEEQLLTTTRAKEKTEEIVEVKEPFVPLADNPFTYYGEEKVKHFMEGQFELCFPKEVEVCLRENLCVRPEARLVDRVTRIQYAGGKYGMGKVEAEKKIHKDFWPFAAHFKNDPVLPGTIMLEGVNQTILFFAAHTGLLGAFEQVSYSMKKESMTKFTFSGQVLPADGVLTYCVYPKACSYERGRIGLSMDAEVIYQNKVVVSEEDIEYVFYETGEREKK